MDDAVEEFFLCQPFDKLITLRVFLSNRTWKKLGSPTRFIVALLNFHRDTTPRDMSSDYSSIRTSARRTRMNRVRWKPTDMPTERLNIMRRFESEERPLSDWFGRTHWKTVRSRASRSSPFTTTTLISVAIFTRLPPIRTTISRRSVGIYLWGKSVTWGTIVVSINLIVLQHKGRWMLSVAGRA